MYLVTINPFLYLQYSKHKLNWNGQTSASSLFTIPLFYYQQWYEVMFLVWPALTPVPPLVQGHAHHTTSSSSRIATWSSPSLCGSYDNTSWQLSIPFGARYFVFSLVAF